VERRKDWDRIVSVFEELGLLRVRRVAEGFDRDLAISSCPGAFDRRTDHAANRQHGVVRMMRGRALLTVAKEMNRKATEA
jgi:hypothetical protein